MGLISCHEAGNAIFCANRTVLLQAVKFSFYRQNLFVVCFEKKNIVSSTCHMCFTFEYKC